MPALASRKPALTSETRRRSETGTPSVAGVPPPMVDCGFRVLRGPCDLLLAQQAIGLRSRFPPCLFNLVVSSGLGADLRYGALPGPALPGRFAGLGLVTDPPRPSTKRAPLQSGAAVPLVHLSEFPSKVSHHVEGYSEYVLPRGDLGWVGSENFPYRAAG
jgi:hypothetical protein